MQSRVVIGLLTGHNTLRRHLYLIGSNNNSSCRICGTEEKLPSTICASVKLRPHSDMQIWVPSSWTHRILRVSVCGPSGTLVKEQGFLNLVSDEEA